ncbi:MAG: ferrochelatase [Desulfuromonadaceae bacterium]|nr:ferrochelatase [Desulfuromonadaceae bacterium]MDD2854582.1 ferrochelatase [Desulfuromonadaceae bacterium]
MERTAVLLLQMGGPDSLESVEPFLYNLFSDRDIIKIGPALLQPFIAKMIVKRRASKSAANYAQIGGKSPLRELTEQQGGALEALLGSQYRCFPVMRYWHPFAAETLAAVEKEGIKKIVALSLYPHYSRATGGSSFNDLDRSLKAYRGAFTLRKVRHFFDHPLYIKALSEKIEDGLKSFADRSRVQLFFSAHSLPQSFITDGDPYLEHIESTVRLVMEQFGGLSHHLAFQSRAGPVKWLEPSTEEKLKELSSTGQTDVLVIPLSFVSDHIETLHEIDIEYAEMARHLGIKNFRRMESLNSSPLFIQCLAQLVRDASA